MPGISGSGTSTPGHSAPGLSSSFAPFLQNLVLFAFGPSIFDIDVLNEFSHCHPH